MTHSMRREPRMPSVYLHQARLATYRCLVACQLEDSAGAIKNDRTRMAEDLRAIAESEEWFRQNGGKGIPHDQVVPELGLE